MNLTKQLIELNKANIIPKKFDTKVRCITYILGYYTLENQLKNSIIFDLFYDLKLNQLQHICHTIKERINNDDEAFDFINDIIKFIKV